MMAGSRGAATSRPGAGAAPPPRLTFAGLEAGGTKFVCLIGSGPDDIVADHRVDTTDPAHTLAACLAFFRAHATGPRAPIGLGIAAFGPLELRPNQPRYGSITATPKPLWSNIDLVGPLARGLGLPVALETDVNAAAIAEGRWGAARGLRTFLYVTVGTGIGGGSIANGSVVRGLIHPEMGHVFVPRHPDDPYRGGCRFHRDCLEGMASGAALQDRFGRRGEALTGTDLERARTLIAFYLAAGLRSFTYVAVPERIVLGGGVAAMPGLLPRLRAELVRQLAGYPGLPEHAQPAFVRRAALGGRAGALGALALGEQAAQAAGATCPRHLPHARGRPS